MKKVPDFIVIDDEPINNIICRKIIQLANPEVTVLTFTDPGEGAAFLNGLPPDSGPYILLLDVNMPVTSGWELLDIAADSLQRHAITTYLLSSSIAASDREQAAQHPLVSDYLIKPLTVSTVLGLLGK